MDIQQEKSKKYNKLKQLGEGSFGKVYLVKNISLNSLCVIKSVFIERMSDEEIKNAVYEAKILEKLDHPNIIRFIECFIHSNPRKSLYIVMDFADNGDLKNKIDSRKGKYFPENEILDIFTQLCLALKHIHERKILHRDIKSPNVLLTSNGIVKLSDFGVSKSLSFTLEKAKTFTGTPYYLSPEIVQNLPYSYKSDMWSLGILLYEMCCLKLPFEAKSLPLLTLKIINGKYDPIPDFYSKELNSIVQSLLFVDNEKRPSVTDILKMKIINSRIKLFLNEKQYNDEFSNNPNFIEERNLDQKIDICPNRKKSEQLEDIKLKNKLIDLKSPDVNISDAINLVKKNSNENIPMKQGLSRILLKKDEEKNTPKFKNHGSQNLIGVSQFKTPKNENKIDETNKLSDLLKIINKNNDGKIKIEKIKKGINEASPKMSPRQSNDISEYIMNVELNKKKSIVEINEITDALNKNKINLNDLTKEDNIDYKDFISNNKEEDIPNNYTEDYQNDPELEVIRTELQNKLGDLYDIIFKIMEDMIPENEITFDKKNISTVIIKKLTNLKCDRVVINIAIGKISEFFSLILQKRESNLSKKRKIR